MKKILLSLLTISLLFTGCSSGGENDFTYIPEKINAEGTSIEASSVTTKNIDNYLFRDDVIYVDLRPYAEIISEGHIAGFSFYPFYDFIATIDGAKDENKNPKDNRLFKMKNESGRLGSVGNFIPTYEESEFILNDLFPKDKYIFAITISCNESVYFLNLLKQYGYDPAKLYNIGGFSINTGLENKAYKNIDDPMHLVDGNPYIQAVGKYETFDFMKGLTPINYSGN